MRSDRHKSERFPWYPMEPCLSCRGRKYTAEILSRLKDEYGIIRHNISNRNPQANAMIEQAHQTICSMIVSQDSRQAGPRQLRERIMIIDEDFSLKIISGRIDEASTEASSGSIDRGVEVRIGSTILKA